MTARGAFLITKPLQYINARNVAEQLGFEKPTLYIIPNFHCADAFIEKLKAVDSFWGRVTVVKSRFWLPIARARNLDVSSELFCDSDLYKDTIFNFISSPFMKVSLYEEGYYSYVKDQSLHMERTGKLKRLWVYNLLGLPKGLGRGFWTKKVYLFKPNLSQLKKGVPISVSFIEYVERNWEVLLKLFDLNSTLQTISHLSCEKLSVYCSGPDPSAVSVNVEKYQIELIKLHPNLAPEKVDLKGKEVCGDGYVPIEMIVLALLKEFCTVRFLHESSSAVLYLSTIETGVEFLNVGSFVTGYDEHFNCVKNGFEVS